MKTCSRCNQTYPLSYFHKRKRAKDGVVEECKSCRLIRSANEWKNKSIERKMLDRTRARANSRGIPFDLVLEDIVIPSHCPVLGTPLEYGSGDNSPSIDRKNPALGYTKDNIKIISNRANMIKSNATSEELRKVYEYCRICGI